MPAMEIDTLPSATRLAQPRRHLPGLDGLRGLAIFAVMFHHLVPPELPAGLPGGLRGAAMHFVFRALSAGWWGVDLFFVLSGFLITGILLEAKGSPHYFGNFYARRSLRIFPLYYGLLTLLFFVLPWLAATPATAAWTQHYLGDLLAIGQANAAQQKWLWFYGSNIRMAAAGNGWIFGSLSHFWSLAVEEHFYLIWPVLVFCCSTRALARVCLALAAASMLCREGFLLGGLSPEYIYVLSPCRFDGLALGGFVAALTQLWRNGSALSSAQDASARPGILPSIRLVFGIEPPANGSGSSELLHAAFSRLFLVLLPFTVLTLLLRGRFEWFVIIIGHTLFACTFAAALPGAVLAQSASSLIRGRWLCYKPLQILGKYSYGLYVLHPFIAEPWEKLLSTPMAQNLLGKSYALKVILHLGLNLPIGLLLAWLVWHGYEKHFLRLKRFFPTQRSTRSVQDNPLLGVPVTTSSVE
jgi:peptidoglycan/LPS O-acetylase OafA/YrhL